MTSIFVASSDVPRSEGQDEQERKYQEQVRCAVRERIAQERQRLLGEKLKRGRETQAKGQVFKKQTKLLLVP